MSRGTKLHCFVSLLQGVQTILQNSRPFISASHCANRGFQLFFSFPFHLPTFFGWFDSPASLHVCPQTAARQQILQCCLQLSWEPNSRWERSPEHPNALGSRCSRDSLSDNSHQAVFGLPEHLNRGFRLLKQKFRADRSHFPPQAPAGEILGGHGAFQDFGGGGKEVKALRTICTFPML